MSSQVPPPPQPNIGSSPQIPLTPAAAQGEQLNPAKPGRNGLRVFSRVVLTIYGSVLGVIGLVILFASPSSKWIGLIPILYGLYLIIPGGRKWVIY